MKLVRYEDWAKPGLAHPGSRDMKLPVTKAFIHHTAGPTPLTPAAEVTLLRQYDAQHRAKGWNGIGYSFIVGPSGTVYEGRGQKVGAHTEGFNSLGFGICFLGTFTDGVPTSAAMLGAAELMQMLISPNAEHGIPGGALRSDFTLTGHRDHRMVINGETVNATACPGNALHRDLPKLRRLVNQKEIPMPDTNVPMAAPPVYKVSAPPVGISVTPSGQGYLIICADGGVFAFGDAVYAGRIEEPVSGAWNRYFGLA